MSLDAGAGAPMTREELVCFLEQLADSFLEQPERWENADLASFW